MKQTELEKTTLRPGGIQTTLKSMTYQIRLIVLVLLQCINKNFQLLTEVIEAGIFDDIVLHIPGEGTRFIQAKFKQINNKSTHFDDFCSEKSKDFQLYKYFKSFLKVRKNFSEIHTVLLVTNSFLSNELMDSKCGRYSISWVKSKEDYIFRDIGKRYQISSDKSTIECLKMHFPTGSVEEIKNFCKHFILVTEFDMECVNKEIHEQLKLQKELNVEFLEYADKMLEYNIGEWIQKNDTRVFDTTKLHSTIKGLASKIVAQKYIGLTSHIVNDENIWQFGEIGQEGDAQIVEQFLLDKSNEVKEQEDRTFILAICARPGETLLILHKYLNTFIQHNKGSDQYLILKTSFSEQEFQTAFDLFLTLDSFILCIIEEDSQKGFINNLIKPRLEHLRSLPNKKIVIISETEHFKDTNYCLSICEQNVIMGNLSDRQIRRILERGILFQNVEIYLKEIASKRSVANINVGEILKTKSIASVDFDFTSCEQFYIPRLLTHLNSKVVINENPILESELESDDWRRVTICDIAGSGKTTFFKNLVNELKKKLPDHWFIRMHLDELSSECFVKNCQFVAEFICDNVLKLNSKFEKAMFVDAYENTGKVIILIDGLDELNSGFSENAISLINTLLASKVKKVFIAIRPEAIDLMDLGSKTEILKFLPFSAPEQKDFLYKYWKLFSLCPNRIQNDGDLRESSNQIVDHLGSVLDNLLDSPLALKIIAEIIDDELNFDDGELKLDYYKLFSKFVDRKFEFFLQGKCRLECSNATILRLVRDFRRKTSNSYKKFAIQQIFEENFDQFANDDLDDMLKVGLIGGVGKNLNFTHTCYFYYFVAKYIIEKTKDNRDDEDTKKIINKVLKRPDHALIRLFLHENF
jgi:hypothetical protein